MWILGQYTKPSVRYVTFRKHPTCRVVDLLPETCPSMSTSNLVGMVASSFSAASLRNCFSVESSSSSVKTTEDELRPLPNVRHAIAQSGHTLLPLRLIVVFRVIGSMSWTINSLYLLYIYYKLELTILGWFWGQISQKLILSWFTNNALWVKMRRKWS